MREDNDRRAVGQICDVLFEPVELFLSERAEALVAAILECSGLRTRGCRNDIVQADVMRAVMVEALPSFPLGSLAEPLQELGTLIGKRVMLARHIKDLIGLETL